MSRGAGGNNVRGPTSALTEFLRESGITPTTIARRAATRAQQQAQVQDQDQNQPVAGPSTQSQSPGSSREATPRLAGTRGRGGRGRGRGRAGGRISRLRYSGNASDDLDDDDDELGDGNVTEQVQVGNNDEIEMKEGEGEEETEQLEAPSSKKRKLTKTTAAKLKALKEKEKKNEKGKGKGKKRKGVKNLDDDEDEDDDEGDDDEDEYTAPSRIIGKGKPAPGSFENCVKCGKRFTVTVYTQAASSGNGWLCHVCTKAAGGNPFNKKGPRGGGRKKVQADKRTINNFEERPFPTLVSLCVQIITKHIDDVEALGDIGTMNVEAISKALSKNRSLTAENAPLFYSPTNTTLTLYDATNLPPNAFETLAYLNPNLTTLRLDFCGQITDSAIQLFATSLPNLTSIELLGPFLIRPDAWIEFFKGHSCKEDKQGLGGVGTGVGVGLERFFITQSPRFDLDCLNSLVECCGGSLKEVRLKEVGKLNDDFVLGLASLGLQDGDNEDENEGENEDQDQKTKPKSKSKLEYLDLSDPSESCSEEAMITLLSTIGENLIHLDLSKHLLLGDEFLERGLGPNMKCLRTLVLNNIPGLTDVGVGKLFEDWCFDSDSLSDLATAMATDTTTTTASSTSTPTSTSKSRSKSKSKVTPTPTPTTNSTSTPTPIPKETSLLKLDLSRNHLLGDKSLKAILKHSGKDLKELNINGWKEVSEEVLIEIGKVCGSLRKLDVGWVRDVTDWVVGSWIDGVGVEGQDEGKGKQQQQSRDQDQGENEDENEDEDEDGDGDVKMKIVDTTTTMPMNKRDISGCKNLEEVKVWGCNRITPACPRRKGMSIYGVEANSIIRSLV